MIGSSRQQRKLMLEASQAGFKMDYARRPSAKPVNSAGCRDRVSSTRRSTRREGESKSMTPDRRSSGEGKYSQYLTAKLDAAAHASQSVSMTARIRKKLKGIKGVPFLKCMASKSAPTAEDDRPKKAKRTKEKENSSKIGKTKSMPHDTTEVEPSLKIRALFPEKADSNKLPIPSPLAKLKNSMFRARSTTPTNFSDITDPPDHPPASPFHSGPYRCRRQENLVKMMEKKLEDQDQREERPASVTSQRRTRTSVKHGSDPAQDAPKDHRHPRNRKIKSHRSKAKKGAHRRTLTC